MKPDNNQTAQDISKTKLKEAENSDTPLLIKKADNTYLIYGKIDKTPNRNNEIKEEKHEHKVDVNEEIEEKSEFEIILMPTQGLSEIKNSKFPSIFLYKNNQNSIFYQVDGKQHSLEDNENKLPDNIRNKLFFFRNKTSTMLS